jgi:AAA domain
MARMIPESPREDATSGAELRLFERLRDDTSDELVAFHSVAWLAPTKDGRPREGEADFVLAHPNQGVLVVEVKGGRIRYDAKVARWASIGKEGEYQIKDPFQQGRNSAHRLIDLIARAKGAGDRKILVGNAVAFPDVRVGEADLKPDAPREIVIDARDLKNLSERLDQLFRYWKGKSKLPGPGKAGISLLEKLLANDFELRRPLALELETEERELLQLTEEQYRVLDLLARQTRAAICGCAGSGKTFLAAEKARRLAHGGFRVLVVCFNVLLAQYLRRGLADVDDVDVFSFDGLCYEIVREAGHEFPEHPALGEEQEHYSKLRREFADWVDIAAGRYGALIVDEAQDIHPDWWLPLQILLEHPDRSPLYVFFDDNQRLFPVPENLPVPGEPIQLSINCRNTQRINALVCQYYRGGTVEALGPEGPPVDAHFYADEAELLKQLDKSVRRWINEAEVDPGDIALLTPKSAERSALWTVEKLGGVELTDDPWETDKILRASIYRFKGLERLVVAMTELDGAKEAAFYVGFSRPNVFLSVFCPAYARHRLPSELVTAAA